MHSTFHMLRCSTSSTLRGPHFGFWRRLMEVASSLPRVWSGSPSRTGSRHLVGRDSNPLPQHHKPVL